VIWRALDRETVHGARHDRWPDLEHRNRRPRSAAGSAG
jgi:hypothetical protein